MPRDPIRPFLQTGLFVLFYLLSITIFGSLFKWMGGYLVGLTVTGLLAAAICNALSIRIHEDRGLTYIGLPWNRAAAWNLFMGLSAGAGAALAVLAPPLLLHASYLTAVAHEPTNWRIVLFTPALLLCGSAGEEMLFHGYAFQILMRAFGPYTTILPVGVIFAALHADNPHASTLGLVNTAGFGILFGFAFLRSRDLWLPIGLHFGWNVALPFFGVNLSGITMRVSGRQLAWNAGTLWSGGDYGPEASILTSGVLLLLGVAIWKMPVTKQLAWLLENPAQEESQAST